MGRDGRRHGPFKMGGGCQNYAPSLGTFCCKGRLEKGIQVVVVLVTMMLTTYHIGFTTRGFNLKGLGSGLLKIIGFVWMERRNGAGLLSNPTSQHPCSASALVFGTGATAVP